MSKSRITIKDLGYSPGQLAAGPKNSILDVPGVHVGQNTVGEDGDDARKGLTVIFPRHPDSITVPCYAGMHTLNGNGEVTGSYQIKDWGFTNTPIALTNSLSLGTVFQSVWTWILKRAQEKNASLNELSHNYGTPVVGETADWLLNDVYQSALTPAEAAAAFENAFTQREVQEGQYGGGAGMTCHMFPGGTGTSSRVFEGYTVGVLCQSNYGHMRDLQIGGVPVGKLLLKEQKELAEKEKEAEKGGKVGEGSIVIILITDAPLLPHQLVRVARHCAVGLGQVGGHGVGRNHSGDIALCLSTANKTDEIVKAPQVDGIAIMETNDIKIIKNESIETLFRAASEATEEAILNSILGARAGRTGYKGYKLDGLPVEKVKELLQKHLVKI
ncbi:peptidase family S58 protein [Rutstroemia sp. NJR-2017a WRK4]|nr:peptidase family S58 protein [Rutstroemia sp. NJR-2017a WRK4]